MKQVLIVLALGIGLAAQGQVVIYKQFVSGTRTGNGEAARFTLTGYVVIDTRSAKCAQINVNNSPKAFGVKTWDDYEAAYNAGSNGKEFYSLFRQSSYADANGDTRMETDVLTGQAAPLAIGAGSPFLYPKTMQLTSRTWFYANSKPCLEEASGKLSFDQKETKAANLANESVSDVVARLSALLTVQGYTPKDKNMKVPPGMVGLKQDLYCSVTAR
jgi:hypothetical protein